jgi:taurine dioxygenase
MIEEQPRAAKSRQKRLPLGSFGVMVGPTTHLADERARLRALRWEHFDARMLAATVGAELSGVDLTTELAEPVIDEIRAALHDYKVIFFRDQPLTPAQHVAFARRFGELEVHPFITPNAEHRELVRFEKSAELSGYENSWHHDVTWREQPSMGAVLHAIRVPDLGGDTLFADMYAAYEGLPDDIKSRIDGMVAVHDYERAFGGFVPTDKKAQVREKYPQVRHPVVCRHAATGRRYLYVNRNFVHHLDVDDHDEGIRLLDLLCRQADLPEYQCRFRWEPHSVAFWDNRAVQHYAASDYWPEVRITERASIIGDRPAA